MRWANVLKHVVTPQLKFMEQSQALLHGDLHTGSILVTPESTQACPAVMPHELDVEHICMPFALTSLHTKHLFDV